MPQYLLRIEGVNFAATVEDTNQLSVQRGSSLLLRQAIKDVEKKFSQLRSVSTGASIGLFQFEAASNQDAVKIRDNIANDYLNTDTNSRYLTFVVDVVAINNDDFERAKEEVIALNRFRQFQQATLVFPPENNDAKIAPCAWDNLRPADGEGIEIVTREKKDHGPAILSLSAEARHNYGRDQKKEFIKQETATASGKNDGLDFDYTNDLQEIADTDTPHLSSLNNKLAVLYFDGNGFGGIQKDLDCKQLQDFDEIIQQKRKKWLRDLIETIQQDKDFKTTIIKKDGTKLEAIRLEILLWGGDELMLAVPAWKGMYVLQHFYQFHQIWPYPDDNKDWENKDKKYLTHAGGLVFCHVKTPIQRIKKLAREIADHIKDEYLGEPKEGKIGKYTLDANLYDYVVLESIDYPTQSWSAFLEKRYTQAIAKNRKPLRPLNGKYKKRKKEFHELTEKLPRRQLYHLVNTIINLREEFAKAFERFTDVVDNASELEEAVKLLFPDADSNQHWLHLLDLWDYFAPENQECAGDETHRKETKT